MIWRSTAVALMTLAVLAACGTSDAALPDDGITLEEIDGVALFTHDSVDHMDALHGGTATIEDECLLVDDAAVVWHESMLDEAQMLVARVSAGEVLQVVVPGGGASIEEGVSVDDFPAAVTARCPVTTIWYGAPGELRIEG